MHGTARAVAILAALGLSASCGGGAATQLGIAAADVTKGPEDKPLAPVHVAWSSELSLFCDDAHLDVVLPFFEGIEIAHPASSLPQTGYASTSLQYPTSLSMPLVLWSCDGDAWTAAYEKKLLDAPPLSVKLETKEGKTTLSLECQGPCELRTRTARGGFSRVAREVASAWRAELDAQVGGQRVPPLASRFREMHYYVHRFLDLHANPSAPTDGGAATQNDAMRVDWQPDALAQRLTKEDATTLIFLYGLDWGAIDRRGAYLWSDGAEATWRRLRDANPRLAIQSWLNLRTYKYAIPKMGIDDGIPESIASAEKIFADGPHEVDQYGFKAKEMCLGSPVWQAARRAELEHLVREGFRVIQLDEFPIAYSWDGAPCRAQNHLHAPNDAADEWRVTRGFVAGLAKFARAHDVLLTTEEPNAALLPYVSGYTDGIYNDPPEVYELWTKSASIRPVPLFSTMFGDLMTPYTRADVKRAPPAGWIAQRKIAR